MHFRQRGVSCHPAIVPFRQTLAPDMAELFNECLTRLYRDPNPDDIRKFPFDAEKLEGYFLYRDDHFAMLYTWRPLGQEYEQWKCHVRVLGAASTDEFEQNPQVLWRWHQGGYGNPGIL